MSTPQQSGTFTIIDSYHHNEPTLTHHCHPRPVAHRTGHSWRWTLCGLGQMDNALRSPLYHSTECFHCPNTLLCCASSSRSIPAAPGHPCDISFFIHFLSPVIVYNKKKVSLFYYPSQTRPLKTQPGCSWLFTPAFPFPMTAGLAFDFVFLGRIYAIPSLPSVFRDLNREMSWYITRGTSFRQQLG